MQVYWNAFMERVKFSAIVNSIWGLGIYPEPLLLPDMQQQQTDSKEPPEGKSESDSTQAQEGTNK